MFDCLNEADSSAALQTISPCLLNLSQMESSLNPTVLLAIFSIIFQLHFISVHSKCPENQKSSLLQLKESLVFKPALSSKLVSWDSEGDCCSWRGVTCNNGGYIIGLDLSCESISGGIDSSSRLFDLHHLQSLSLAINRFNFSQIPPEFGKLVNLRYLNLSYSEFSGQIPVEISNLTKLISLDLSTFNFPGYPSTWLEVPNLLMLIQNLTRLTELDLSGVNISASGHEWCQALSSSLPNLQVLKLARCSLSGSIDSSLLNLKYLSVISLNGNNLSTKVPEFFANFTRLKSLSLKYCGFYGTFPEKIFHLPELENIDISQNYQLQGFLPEFHQNGTLQSIMLGETSLTGLLPNSMGFLKRLSMIDLHLCNFIGSIPDSMVNLTQLIYVDISYNQFDGSLPSFSMLKNVTHIDISSNDFTGDITSTSWEVLIDLVSLNLHNNSLTGFIPLSLFSLPSLKTITLSNNKFAGQLIDFSVSSSCQLYTLDLSGNKLEGSIPKSLFELCGLGRLILSSNNFNGRFELSTIQKLGNLSHLDLSFNNLSVIDDFGNSDISNSLGIFKLASCNLGKIPGFLRNQSSLVSLDLSDNQLTGEIPNWIWKLPRLVELNISLNFLMKVKKRSVNYTSLAILDFHSNLLEGDIPIITVDNCYFDLSDNNFTSVIPPDIGNILYDTVFFSLSSNNLQGIIPESLCNVGYLRVLDLSNNALSGRLPECLFAINETLRVLNLRGNRFNGTIPEVYSDNCGLQTLDLNENLLQGKLPRSLSNCKMLEVLDIGNNQINDSFPSWLSSIPSLRVLVLRSNFFHGPIYCPEKNSSWPMLKIVDLASNYFNGIPPNQCLTKWEAMIVGENIEALSDFKSVQVDILQLSQLYYKDAITVTIKGVEMQMTKILTVFAAIDFSCNSFHGPIPEAIGSFNAVYVLNFSHNAFTGQIPNFMGNLRKLESVDLSSNNLSGEIPMQLTNLNFLSFLNLSNNELVGKIPVGTQIQSFPEASFANNTALCGLPLKERCGPDEELPSAVPSVRDGHSNSARHINWDLISAEIGFVCGFGAVILPLMFSRKYRMQYYNFLDDIYFRLLHSFRNERK